MSRAIEGVNWGSKSTEGREKKGKVGRKERKEKKEKRRRDPSSSSPCSVVRRGTSDQSRDTAVRRSAAPPSLVDGAAMPGPRADQYFGSGTRRGGRGRAGPSAAEPRHEATRVPQPWAALPAQSLCGSGRRGMCGIVTASVTEE